MRLVGILALLLGSAGTAYATWASFHARRPLDLAWGLLAPFAAFLAILGLITTVFPDFL